MARNPEADLVAQLVGDPAQADQVITVVGNQVLTATPADVGKVVTVDSNGTLVLGAGGGGLDPADQAKLDDISVTQPVDLDQMEADIASLNSSLVLRGTWDASAGTFPGGGTAQAGAVYIVSVAGTVNAVAFAVGDRIVAIVDNASTSTFAANWFKEDYTDQVLSVDGQTGAVSIVTQTITNGVTNRAPSEDAVFDALALKAALAYGTFVRKVRQTLTNKTSFAGTAAEQWGTEESVLDDALLPALTSVTVDARCSGFIINMADHNNALLVWVDISLDGGSTWSSGQAVEAFDNTGQASDREIVFIEHLVTGTVTGDIQARAMASSGSGASCTMDLTGGVLYMDVLRAAS